MRLKLLIPAFALSIGLIATTVLSHDRATPRVLTTAVVKPVPVYTGPTTDPGRELVAAIKKAQQVQWYAEAKRQQDEAAAKPVTVSKPSSKPSSAPTAPAPSGSALKAIAAYFGDVYDSAVGVAQCESGLDPTAVSPGGGNWGLFQINTVHKADFVQFANAILDEQSAPADDPRRSWQGGVLNAWLNAAYARKVYDGNNGWGPWTCKWAA